MEDVFAYRDYKKYLNDRLDDETQGGGRGARSELAKAIGCQTAYVAQVLRGDAHFSLEQGELANDFLNHANEHGQFFLLLIQVSRAGILKLKRRFEAQMQSMIEGRMSLKNRLGVKAVLNQDDQVLYYSSWIYGAVHTLVSVPGFQTVDAISSHLKIEARIVAEAIEFLSRSGLITGASGNAKNPLRVGQTSIHLPSDSPLISKHHINWRLQAIHSIERANSDDLHYSSIASISDTDAKRIRERLIEEIKKIKAIVRDSPEEGLQSLCIDFFTV